MEKAYAGFTALEWLGISSTDTAFRRLLPLERRVRMHGGNPVIAFYEPSL